MTDKLNSPSYEQNLARLEKLVGCLEQNSLGLEESLQLFEEGMALAQCCGEQLDVVEERVKVLVTGSELLAMRKELPFERVHVEQNSELVDD